MKEKLEKVQQKSILGCSYIRHILCSYNVPTDFHDKLLVEIKEIEENIALIDSILADLDSPDLVEKVAVAMKKKDDELLSTGWGGRMDWHRKVGKAAIEAITV